MENRGLVLVNTGSGKGKTTASLGLALRAYGNGMKVNIVQFIKGSWKYGELKGIERLAPEVQIHPMGNGFVFHKKDANEETIREHRKKAQKAWELIVKEMHSGKWDVMILDEINVAIHYGLLCADTVLEALKQRPKELHVVLTGRYADQKLIDYADTVTEMVPVKHAYQQGIKAARGIEF